MEHRIHTIADLLNLVTVENCRRLSDDLLTLLRNHSDIKLSSHKDLVVVDLDCALTWIDNGQVKSTINIILKD